MGVEFNIALTKPELEVGSEDGATFNLTIKDGAMNVLGIDFLFEYYPALSKVADDVNSFLKKDDADDIGKKASSLMNINYSARFSNSEVICANPKMPLKYGDQYVIVGEVGRLIKKVDSCCFYEFKSGDCVPSDGAMPLRVVVLSDEKVEYAAGRRYLITAFIKSLMPFEISFTVVKSVLLDENQDFPDERSRQNFMDILDILSIQDDGRAITILEKKEIDLRIRQKVSGISGT